MFGHGLAEFVHHLDRIVVQKEAGDYVLQAGGGVEDLRCRGLAPGLLGTRSMAIRPPRKLIRTPMAIPNRTIDRMSVK